MLQSFLTVGQQIITLYLLMVVGFVLGKAKLRLCGPEHAGDVRGVTLYADGGVPAPAGAGDAPRLRHRGAGGAGAARDLHRRVVPLRP